MESSKLYISDFIIFETITFLSASLKNHNLAINFLDYIYNQENIEVIEVDKQIKESALSIFIKYKDKNYSFTDCTSFVIMNRYNLSLAYSFDDHFLQMGYSII